MYLDIMGLVTTGLGNLIDTTGPPPLRQPTDSERAASHDLARQLAWQTSDGSLAAADQVDAEWDQIKARLDQAQFGGGTFQQVATLVLSDDEIDRLVFGKLDQLASTTFLRMRNWACSACPGEWARCSTSLSSRALSGRATGPARRPNAGSNPISVRSPPGTTGTSSCSVMPQRSSSRD
jgi:hypothetical protein